MAIATKNKWYQIVAPAMFNEQEIGETYVAEPEKTIGRTANINLMVLTNDPKRQNINVGFKIIGVEGEKLKTEIYRYNLMPSSLKRFIRRGRDRIDDSFVCVTSDNKNAIIKPLLVTRSKTKDSVLSALRANTRKFLKDLTSKTKFDNLIKDILSHKVQNELKNHLKKIYGLRTCEIRSIEYKMGVGKTEKLEVKEDKEEEVKEEKREEKKETKKEEESSEKEEIKAEKKEKSKTEGKEEKKKSKKEEKIGKKIKKNK